jgi:hypothetical protein
MGEVVNATISHAPVSYVEIAGPEFACYVAHCPRVKPEPLPLVNGRFLYLSTTRLVCGGKSDIWQRWSTGTGTRRPPTRTRGSSGTSSCGSLHPATGMRPVTFMSTLGQRRTQGQSLSRISTCPPESE